MAESSFEHAPPSAAPGGLERLASVWTAPLRDYAPPFLRSRALGYALSAMFGAGLVVLAVTGLSALVRLRQRSRSASNTVSP